MRVSIRYSTHPRLICLSDVVVILANSLQTSRISVFMQNDSLSIK